MNTNKDFNIDNMEQSVLDHILSQITPEMQLATDRQMALAAKIAIAKRNKGYTNEVLAEKLGVSIYEIEYIQSGCCNITSDKLFLLGDILEIELINLKK